MQTFVGYEGGSTIGRDMLPAFVAVTETVSKIMSVELNTSSEIALAGSNTGDAAGLRKCVKDGAVDLAEYSRRTLRS